MKTKHAALIVIALLFMCSCAMIPTKPSPLTPQEQFLQNAEQAYITQYNDYLAMRKLPNPSPDQVKVMQVKYSLLQQVEPLIKLYRTTVIAGGVPDVATETQINNILNQLGSKI
jgi:hypothetical protein